MEIDKVGTIIAMAVGIYGAILSTFLFIREGRKARRSVHIICEETIEKWPQDQSIRPLPEYAAITLRTINTSYRPVVIVAAGFYLSNGQKIEKVGDEGGLPKKISDGESIATVFGIASLENKLDQLPSRRRAHKCLKLRSPFYRVPSDPLLARLEEFEQRGEDISLDDLE